MKLTTLLSLALASLATSMPAAPASSATKTLATRNTPFGAVYVTQDKKSFSGNLEVNGGCVTFNINAVYAEYTSAYKCRFYK
jgi:hypothetical protein